ncbi:MAG: UDP-N-acetylmuramoyl-tripeptide--D-alanyl-D-alanine ligase [Oscillospiraceae bacterium]|nr:UDP-N-acetylmuramoyl-tripeptide--D-alanyl-D-alanine ligase [Oscillospiraceae bacterium]
MEFLRPALLAVWWLSLGVTSLRFVHMFQLSAYQTPGFLRWLRQHGGEVYQRMIWALLPVLLSLWGEDWPVWLLLASIGFYVLSAVAARPPRGAKKPLKYTSRVARLLVTLGVLAGAAAWGFSFLWGLPTRFLAVLLGAGYFLAPLFVLAANAVNIPVQKLIEWRYIRDAKRRLADCPKLTVIGLTGSYGKTSVKHFLHRLLSESYNTLITPGSYNTPMGVVKTIRGELRPTHEFFVCEMGARHVGDIKELCGIVHPRHGLITTIGPQHLETFGTQERIADTKFELIDALPHDGVAFLNMNCELIRDRRVDCRRVRFGLAEDGAERAADWDYRGFDLKAGPEGLSFSVAFPDGELRRFSTALIGRHNAENILAALAVAHHFGVPPPRLAAAVRALEPVAHRLRLLPRGAGLSIIDDAFNANPEGARAALETLDGFDGVKILVTPGFVELGERQDECHETLGWQASAVCDFVALVGRRQTEAIARGLKAAGFPEERLLVADTLGEAMVAAQAWPSAGREKYVLLENDLPDNY